MDRSWDQTWASAAEIARAVAAGETTALAVTEAALKRIEARNPVLNAFTAVTRERALAQARAIDAARSQGAPLGPLAGVPFAVKNLFDIAGLPTLAGSKINREHPPAPRDATLIARLEAAGAVLLGALNMGEYAYDFTGENVHYGPSRNPHDTTRMTGGSSGGSGGAVAGGLVPLSLGLRHQRLDPRAVLVLRPVRAETHLRPALAGAHVPVRGEPRPRRAAGAHGARPGAGLRRHAGPRSRRSGARRAPGGAGSTRPRPRGRGPAHRRPAAAISSATPHPRRWRPWAGSPRHSASRARWRSPRLHVPAPPPTSSPPPRAARCISTGCARARPISIRPCATA